MNPRRATAQVFDQFSVFVDDQPVSFPHESRRAIALLIAVGSEGATPPRLVAELWPRMEPELAQEGLERISVSVTETCPGLVESSPELWRLTLPSDQVDLWAFHQLATDPDTDWSSPENLSLLLAKRIFPDVDNTGSIVREVGRYNAMRRKIARRQAIELGSPVPDWVTTAIQRSNRRPTTGAPAIVQQRLPEMVIQSDERFLTIGATKAADHAIDQLLRSTAPVPVLLITGVEGSGKSRMLGRTAKQLWERGWHVIDGLDSGEEADSNFSATAVIVDDIHDLDPEEASTLDHLRTETESGRRCLLLAGADPHEPTAKLRRNLIRAGGGMVYLPLEPLELSDVMEIVSHRFVGISSTLLPTLAADLTRTSHGLPAALEAALELVDETTFTMIDEPAPTAHAIKAALAAVERSQTRGRFRDVVHRLSAIKRIEGVELDFASKTTLVTALHRTGTDDEAARLRAELVDEALVNGNHNQAVAAALIGLPESERVDGDQSRLEQLLSIDPDRLEPESRFEHANAVFRQAMLLGQMQLAERWQKRSIHGGQSTSEQGEAAIADWYASITTSQPAERLLRTEALVHDPGLSPFWKARLHQIRSIDRFELGQVEEAIADNNVLEDYAIEHRDQLRRWHAMTFSAMAAFNLGRWDEAERLRDKLLAHANHYAIVEGEALYIAQVFHQSWLQGRHRQFADLTGRLPADIAETRFGRAAAVSAHVAAADVDQATVIGQPLVDEVLARPNYDSPVTIALLAPFIAGLVSPEIADRAIQLLSPRAGSALVAGSGIACFGPTDRYLFQLTGDRAHLDGAIAWADRAGLPTWQITLRADYERAGLPGADFMRRQALAMADQPGLMSLLDPES